jgi:hypothetical protein
MVSAFERMSKRALPTAVLLALAALVSGTSATARAGQYHVYSCRTPSGESAPADGWSGSVAAEGKADDYAENTCGGGGALVAALGDETNHIANTDQARWAFEAPATERLIGATLWRAGYLHGRSGEGATYEFWLAGPTPTDVFDECVYTELCDSRGDPAAPMSGANKLTVPVANLGPHLTVTVACATGLPGNECDAGFGDPNGYAAVVYLYAADLTLEQSVGPSASDVTGELASAPAVAGTSDVAFSASDPGSGVYEAVFSVDGQVVQSTVIDEDGGRCRNVGQTSDGLPAFLYVQPCPSSVSADVGLDTTKLADGAHHLVVTVIDAAGNAATVLDRDVTIANPATAGPAGSAGPASGPGPANGTNASAQAALSVSWNGTGRQRLTSVYGRAQTVVGRLTGAGGVPIAGAQIGLLATPDYADARTSAMPSPHTGADGRFSIHLPRGVSSRTLHISYRSHLGDALAAVTRTLVLSVRAGVSLSIAPRTASVGRSIRFSGRLPGAPIPAGGKPLVLEARSPGGRWLEFDVVRTDTRGRYHASYRFKFPGPAQYQFRVLCEAESDYPYAAGSSQVVGVRES